MPERLPEDLPYPVVFGPSFPDYKQLMREGRQTFESRTNQNLFLGETNFTEAGTYTMGSLLTAVSSWQDLSPLVFDEVWEDDGRLVEWGRVVGEPQWEQSEAFTRLLGYCGSEAEQEFLLEWCRLQFLRGLPRAWDQWWSGKSKTWAWIDEDLHEIVSNLVRVVFDFPALIPEVWLNYVGTDKTEADVEHLASNPGRVDFVLLAERRKCVIEIDGPSHYADMDSQGYVVNEQVYAKNLRIERSLRRQGWDIFRFARVEALSAQRGAFAELIRSAQVPGFLFANKPYVESEWAMPRVSVEEIVKATDPVGLPF